MTSPYRYCPQCGAPLAEAIRFGRPRGVCRYCGFVHFRDPKVAVAALVADGSRVLLVRRAAMPRIGSWAFPAGYMDADELPEDALVREVAEETGLRVTVEGLLGIAPLAGWEERRGILLLYLARPVSGHLAARDDVSDARWFEPSEIPWDDLAFASSAAFLREWLASLRPAMPDQEQDPSER